MVKSETILFETGIFRITKKGSSRIFVRFFYQGCYGNVTKYFIAEGANHLERKKIAQHKFLPAALTFSYGRRAKRPWLLIGRNPLQDQEGNALLK